MFGVTAEAYIVFVANAFALLGLRALFFLVKGLLDRLVYLSTGLSVILAFIGVKLILHWAHDDISPSVPEISTPVSLVVIVAILVVVTVASLVKTRRDPTAKAHAGSLRARKRGGGAGARLAARPSGRLAARHPGAAHREELDQVGRGGEQVHARPRCRSGRARRPAPRSTRPRRPTSR